eukprot:1138213-Pelagomonas_calceolata.AAC.2
MQQCSPMPSVHVSEQDVQEQLTVFDHPACCSAEARSIIPCMPPLLRAIALGHCQPVYAGGLFQCLHKKHWKDQVSQAYQQRPKDLSSEPCFNLKYPAIGGDLPFSAQSLWPQAYNGRE